MDIESERSANNSKDVELIGTVSLNKVGLRYTRESDPVFSGLSINAKPGDLVAIAGGNGMGKSTVLKLINGLYRPQAGTVRIDGMDIRQMDPVGLRRQIGYVSQAPEFFRGTIMENMRFAEPLATDEQIHTALAEADALDEIESQPKGLETMLGRGLSSQLPASLTYKINLARAYLKNSPVLLIDELPYELLASKAGESFKQMLLSWKGKKTIFLITHRDDFIALSDIAVLLRGNEGSLVGKPEQVLALIKNSRELIS